MRLRSEFLTVRKQGRSFGGRFLVLSVLPDRELEEFKVGFIVPKRVGNAVARNLVKRRLHGIVGGKSVALNPNYFVVTIARRGAAEQSFATLKKEWHRLARRAKLDRTTAPASDDDVPAAAGEANDPTNVVKEAPPVTRH